MLSISVTRDLYDKIVTEVSNVNCRLVYPNLFFLRTRSTLQSTCFVIYVRLDSCFA